MSRPQPDVAALQSDHATAQACRRMYGAWTTAYGTWRSKTRRRAVCVGRPIAASAGSVLAGESFTLKE